MKKVLVMGGSYFIGKKIVEVLKNNYEVTVLNRGTKEEISGINHIKCDRNDKYQMINMLSNSFFDIIIDVSCLNARQAEILLESVQITNLQKIVFISSSAVYDIEKLSPPFKESDTLGYNNYWKDYGLDKIEAEKVYENFAKMKSIPVIMLRPPYVYGENNYAQRESFIFNHIERREPIIVPQVDFKIQFIYSGDLANIVMLFIETKETTLVNIFNVGNKDALTVTQWIKECSNVVNKNAKIVFYDHISKKRNVRDFFPFYDYDNYLDVNLINEFYTNSTSMQEGLNCAYQWYRDEKANIKFKENVRTNEQEILKEIKIIDEHNLKYR